MADTEDGRGDTGAGLATRGTGSRRAFGVVALGVVLAVAVLVGGAQALKAGSPGRVAVAPSAVASSPTAPSGLALVTESVDPDDGGEHLADAFPGDAQQRDFFLWAANHRVGTLNLPLMDSAGPLTDLATGYCALLTDEPSGSGASVTRHIRRQTGASLAESRELLERSVQAFCPQKVRHLV